MGALDRGSRCHPTATRADWRERHDYREGVRPSVYVRPRGPGHLNYESEKFCLGDGLIRIKSVRVVYPRGERGERALRGIFFSVVCMGEFRSGVRVPLDFATFGKAITSAGWVQFPSQRFFLVLGHAATAALRGISSRPASQSFSTAPE